MVSNIMEEDKWKTPCVFCGSKYKEEEFIFRIRHDGSIGRRHKDMFCSKNRQGGHKNDFIGTIAEGESAVDQASREAEWKSDHSCHLCGRFECDGHCEDGGY